MQDHRHRAPRLLALTAALFLANAASGDPPAAPQDDAVPTVSDTHTAKSDPRDNLIELARRTRIKPNDLLRTPAGHFPSERVVFRDTVTGLQIWKLTRNPGINRHGYSNVPVWNIDGSRMLLRGERPGSLQYWVVSADAADWAPFPREGAFGWLYWSPLNRDKVYSDEPTPRDAKIPVATIFETDVAFGKSRQLWKIPVPSREWKLVPPSSDGKKFLLRERGSGANPTSFGELLNTDGTGKPQRFELGTGAGQTWFLKRPDYSFMFDATDKATGGAFDQQRVCEPAKNGAIRTLDANRHFFHAGVSPSGKWVAHQINPGLWVSDADTGARRLCVRGPNTGGGHLSWECDDRWLVASMGNGIYEVFLDSKAHPPRLLCVPNTSHNQVTECEPESSPDGTKFAYVSSMLGDCDIYMGVQRLPDPPRNVRREGRVLMWEAPERCKELAGYCVYRGQELLSAQLIHDRRYELPPDADGAEQEPYTVVAVEHSGLQSLCPDHQPPPPPVDVVASAPSPFAVELTWQPSGAKTYAIGKRTFAGRAVNDVSYYNVYCAAGATPRVAQECRIASPTEPHLLDWGLQTGTSYQYLVTAVDRAGNESAPAPLATITTPAITRAQQHVAVNKPLGKTPLVIPLHTPTDARYLIWIELKSGAVTLKQPLTARIDNGKAILWTPPWYLVSVGHGGPQSTPFAAPLTPARQLDPWQTLTAGDHRLELTLPQGSAEVISVMLTNDAGFVPEGVTRFQPRGE